MVTLPRMSLSPVDIRARCDHCGLSAGVVGGVHQDWKRGEPCPLSPAAKEALQHVRDGNASPFPFMRDGKSLQMYVITHGAKDLPPGKYCVREHVVCEGKNDATTRHVMADDLEGARRRVPAWADQNIGRDGNDDPVIVEVWV